MEDAVVHSEYGTVANKSTDDFVTSKQYGVQQGLEYRVIHQSTIHICSHLSCCRNSFSVFRGSLSPYFSPVMGFIYIENAC